MKSAVFSTGWEIICIVLVARGDRKRRGGADGAAQEAKIGSENCGHDAPPKPGKALITPRNLTFGETPNGLVWLLRGRLARSAAPTKRKIWAACERN
jgi:hypothetical protein